jgi:hypothetical protein
MLYFLLKPDFKILSKYFDLGQPVDEMEKIYADGFEVVVDWYYTDEMVAKVENDFRAILIKHKIEQHYDNLMFMLLPELQTMESTMFEVNNGNVHRSMLKELSQLLLIYQETPENKEINLAAKTFNNTVKVTNQKLSRWIGKLIKENIENGKYLISDLGFETDNLFLEEIEGKRTLSLEKLKEASKIKLHDRAKIQKQLIAELCFFQILPYINGETELKKVTGTNFSDAQLNFLFDTLLLFDLIPAGNFDSSMDYEPKDFMRNYLMKYAKSLINNGNANLKK